MSAPAIHHRQEHCGATGSAPPTRRATINHRTGQRARRTALISALSLAACTFGRAPKDATKLTEFATRYTAAWCSRDPARVASFFAENGSLQINAGKPSIGRAAITAAAQGFMTAFPDMVVKMDAVTIDHGRVTYRWTLTGTNTGPGGSGRPVHISGHEEWTIGDDGLIAESKGHFDEAEYQRQLKTGTNGAT
jgi:steroid delta-isomerase-like uncharacterized protein